MSTSAGPGRPGALNSTQQQLAELDALLERMLALPVNQLDANDGPPADFQGAARLPNGDDGSLDPSHGMDMPEPGERLQTLTLLPVAGEVMDEPVPEPEAFEVPPEDWAANPPPAVLMPVERYVPPSDRDETATSAFDASFTRTPEPLLMLGLWVPGDPRRPHVKSPREGVALWLQLLVWANQAFDWCASWLGAPGRWLTGRRGRAVLGWSGVLLLLGAAVWGILDWAGWTW